ncbi:Coq4 family protein [Fischerella sp. PCC 9605]|uniref:Coq4 family protein n=1 Tax=Fischerella sp. PCC 9605 TaxID=1173024 RepID=UPI0004795174|nr:Coq4 family protein [Fischerella sp. PCC 9605]
MQAFTTSPNPTVRIQKFLDLVDRVTEKQGLNVTQIVDIQKLRSLPIGTFGRTWADFLDENNLTPFTTGPRRKQLHDGVHVLTEYSTDYLGEAEVQAFLLGAKFRLVNLLLGLGLLRMMSRQMQDRQQLDWERLWQAYQRGSKSHFDPDTWQPELLWHLPLKDVQAIFAIY